MEEPVLAFPVACPLCQSECLCRLPLSMVAGAMITRTPLTLKSSCHSVEWPANLLETEQIREYFVACFATRR
jgi:hypothetical protein